MPRKPSKKTAKKVVKKKSAKTRLAPKAVAAAPKRKVGRPPLKKKAVAESTKRSVGQGGRARKRFSEEQIRKMLREAESRGSAAVVIEKYGISKSSFYAWRQKLGGSSAG